MKSIDVFTRDLILKMVSLNTELNKEKKDFTKIEDTFANLVKKIYLDIYSGKMKEFWCKPTHGQPRSILILFKIKDLDRGVKLDIKQMDISSVSNFLLKANVTILDNYDIYSAEFNKSSHFGKHRLVSNFLEKAIATDNFPICEIEALRKIKSEMTYKGYDFSIIENVPIFKAYLEGVLAYLIQNNSTIEKSFNIDENMVALKDNLKKSLKNKEKISLGF